MFHLGNFTIEEAADVICCTVKLDRFQTTVQSQPTMDDLALAAQIRARLIERYPRVNSAARQGVAYIALEGGTASEEKAIRDVVAQIPRAKKIETKLYPLMTPD